MEELKKTILNTFGERGKAWLAHLDQTVAKLQQHWQLKEVHPVKNLSYNFVAKALDNKNHPVILKICCDKKVFEAEARALSFFQGKGSVQILDRNDSYNALLLQQAIPGISLKDLYPAQFDLVINAYVKCVKTIHEHPLPTGFPSFHLWLDDLEKPCPPEIPQDLFQKAKEKKNRLLKSPSPLKLLHGDLHLDNVLKDKEDWLAIDPKGIIGEPEFEIAAFDFISTQELHEASADLLLSRIERVANKAKLSSQRIEEWTFVRLVLSAIWSIEDKEAPSKALKLASLLCNH